MISLWRRHDAGLGQSSFYLYVKHLLFPHSQGKCHKRCHLWAYRPYLKEKSMSIVVGWMLKWCFFSYIKQKHQLYQGTQLPFLCPGIIAVSMFHSVFFFKKKNIFLCLVCGYECSTCMEIMGEVFRSQFLPYTWWRLSLLFQLPHSPGYLAWKLPGKFPLCVSYFTMGMLYLQMHATSSCFLICVLRIKLRLIGLRGYFNPWKYFSGPLPSLFELFAF